MLLMAPVGVKKEYLFLLSYNKKKCMQHTAKLQHYIHKNMEIKMQISPLISVRMHEFLNVLSDFTLTTLWWCCMLGFFSDCLILSYKILYFLLLREQLQ